MLMGSSLNTGPIDTMDYLTIEALEDNLTVTTSEKKFYCIDGSGKWNLLVENVESIPISKGQKISFKDASRFITIYSINKKCNVEGVADTCTFYGSPIIDASKLTVTSLGSSDYERNRIGMFEDCTLLVYPPKLSPGSSYAPWGQFYSRMFYRCSSLIVAPELPKQELYNSCFYYMFAHCTSLTEAPELPFAKLAELCYRGMFEGCTSLNKIKMLATDVTASGCMDAWVSGVSPTGTFVKNSAATWDIVGVNGVPEGWTIEYADS